MADQLARIDWKMGQTLLPEHFIEQENALIADAAARFSLLGLPMYGIGRLKWNETLLEQGIVSLASLAAVLPTGQLLQVPGNARAQGLNLNTVGATRVVVYLHLTDERTAASDNGGATSEDGERIEKFVHSLFITAEQSHKGAVATLKLAEFRKSVDGSWGLSPSYVPPLLQVGTSPFLQELMDRLSKAVLVFQEKLQEDIAASYLGGEGLYGAKSCLRALYAFQRLLLNLDMQVHVHPYHLYEALKLFYAEVCLYQNRTPEDIVSPYRHEDLAGTLSKVAEPLLEHLQLTKGKAPYVAFEKKDGLFVLRQLPEETRAAKEVYFLLQKPRVSDVVPMEAFKIASPTRLPIVHKLSLVGVPVRKLERPPFQAQFGPEVEFYQLGFGDEWDLALREGALAFYETQSLGQTKAFLYWRNV